MTSTLRLPAFSMLQKKKGKKQGGCWDLIIWSKETSKFANDLFLLNTLSGPISARALICCVYYEEWKAAIITGDLLPRRASFHLYYTLWSLGTTQQALCTSNISTLIKLHKMGVSMSSIMHKKLICTGTKRHTEHSQGFKALPKSTKLTEVAD